jgi:tetratricopeptide (TPR) repeat protein
MKTSVILFVVACGVVAGGIVYLNHHKAAPQQPAPIAESTPAETAPEFRNPPALRDGAPIPNEKPSAAGLGNSSAIPTAVAADAKPADQPNPVSKTVDALLAAGKNKQAMLDQLRKDGHLDNVIAELQQRMAADPNDAKIATTLGEVLLDKVRALHESGNGDYNQLGILAMQADQDFNAALKLDPQNWEAQFVKCASMVYWPANPQYDNDTVQRLSGLIDQQETMPQQSEFAQTYVILGNEYQKLGKAAEAEATWALGAQKFPGDPALQQKISGNK